MLVLQSYLDLLDVADSTRHEPNQPQLSDHFTLAELTSSTRARAHGIQNAPGPTERAALEHLCVTILEPIRTKFGPVYVSSGYRSPKLNALVGGAQASQHVRGEAADIRVARASITELYKWIACESQLPFDQVIWEYGRWVHVSAVAYGPARNQALKTRVQGTTTFYDHLPLSEILKMR